MFSGRKRYFFRAAAARSALGYIMGKEINRIPYRTHSSESRGEPCATRRDKNYRICSGISNFAST